MRDRLNIVQSSFERVPLAAQISWSSLNNCLHGFAAQVQPHTPSMSLDSLRHMPSSLGKAQLTQRGHDHKRWQYNAMAIFVRWQYLFFIFIFWAIYVGFEVAHALVQA